jgi:hypothetical protein
MEIVDKSMRETRRSLKAMATGGVTQRYSTRHQRIHQNPVMVSFIRPAGLNQPWGVAFGRVLDAEPKMAIAADPRKPELISEAMGELATYLLEQFGVANFASHPLTAGTIKPEDMPQLWLADSANLAMLHNLSFAYFTDSAGDPTNKLAAMARLFSFLYEHATIRGQQLVVNATELLNNLYVLPADARFSSNLASSLTWINSGVPLDQTRLNAIRALDGVEGVTVDRTIENALYATISSLPLEIPTPDSVGKLVRQQLEPQLARRWALLKAAWQVANQDGRSENQHVETFVVDSLLAFRRDFQSLELGEANRDKAAPRAPLTDHDSTQAALHYLRALEADEKFLTHIVHDDVEFLGDLFYDGVAFVGQVISAKEGEMPGEWLWRVRLNEKFGRLLKKRAAESYCLVGNVANPTIAISGFEKIASHVEGEPAVWVIDMTWSKKNALKFSFSTHTDMNNSESWIGMSLIFVPSFAENLHRDAQNVVTKSPGRPGAWLIQAGEKHE